MSPAGTLSLFGSRLASVPTPSGRLGTIPGSRCFATGTLHSGREGSVSTPIVSGMSPNTCQGCPRTEHEYREHAAECLRLSSAARDPGAKAHYVMLAQAWTDLAATVENQFSGVTEAASRLLTEPFS